MQRQRKVEIDREDSEADRAERDQADFHLMSGEAFAQERADADAEREGDQHDADDPFGTADDVLRNRRELREKERAVKPEPGIAEQREEHGARLERGVQVVPSRYPRTPVDLERR